jgi:hypothetical protein
MLTGRQRKKLTPEALAKKRSRAGQASARKNRERGVNKFDILAPMRWSLPQAR